MYNCTVLRFLPCTGKYTKTYKYVRGILCTACVYVTRVIKWVHLQIFLLFAESIQCRKIRLIESNAKCRYLKKWTCEGTLRQVFYLSEDPLIL
jgi:hypothetical protein